MIKETAPLRIYIPSVFALIIFEVLGRNHLIEGDQKTAADLAAKLSRFSEANLTAYLADLFPSGVLGVKAQPATPEDIIEAVEVLQWRYHDHDHARKAVREMRGNLTTRNGKDFATLEALEVIAEISTAILRFSC